MADRDREALDVDATLDALRYDLTGDQTRPMVEVDERRLRELLARAALAPRPEPIPSPERTDLVEGLILSAMGAILDVANDLETHGWGEEEASLRSAAADLYRAARLRPSPDGGGELNAARRLARAALASDGAQPDGYLTPGDVARIRRGDPQVPSVNVWAVQDEGDLPIYIGGRPMSDGAQETALERFVAMVKAHAYPLSPERCESERVPKGTASVGRLWVTPDCGLVVTDGSPSDMDEDDPLAHNCDAMGCSTVSHVVARLPAPLQEADDGE